MFTHTPLIPENNLEYFLQVIFEYFGFDAALGKIPHMFTSYYYREIYPDINPLTQLVVDSGFTSTTVVPILNNKPILHGIRRIDIGGKLMTNYLKECVIFKLYNVLVKQFNRARPKKRLLFGQPYERRNLPDIS
jgi:actin-related protein 6